MSDAATRTTSVSHDKYDRLIAAAQKETTIKVAVAHPCDEVSLRGVVEAANLRLVDPILVGPVERVRAVAAQSNIDISAIELVNSEHSEDSAAKAVELVTAGKVEALMKGDDRGRRPLQDGSRGQITGAILDGPLALDNAISLEAAAVKKITSPVAGRANVLVVPDLEAGNMLAKSSLVSR